MNFFQYTLILKANFNIFNSYNLETCKDKNEINNNLKGILI